MYRLTLVEKLDSITSGITSGNIIVIIPNGFITTYMKIMADIMTHVFG